MSPLQIQKPSQRSKSANVDDRNSITIWVIEDDALFRTTLVSIVDAAEGLRCEFSFDSCEALLEKLEREFAPDVVLMDIGLPGIDGIEGVRRIKAISPATDILMLTIFEEDEKIFKAICAGANGYLLKSSPANDILSAIHEVLNGGAPMNAKIARRVLDMFSDFGTPKGDYGLTEREKDILRLMIDGLTKKVIADELFLSFHTIDTHIKNIYQKLQVHSKSGAVAKVLKERLL